MKGVVFTEFFDMVEESFSPELAERIIDMAALPNEGAYTAVGTYDAGEMVRLVGALSQETGTPVPDLLFAFGRFLVTAALWHGARSAPYTEPDCDEPVSATSSALLQWGVSDFSSGARAFLPSR